MHKVNRENSFVQSVSNPSHLPFHYELQRTPFVEFTRCLRRLLSIHTCPELLTATVTTWRDDSRAFGRVGKQDEGRETWFEEKFGSPVTECILECRKCSTWLARGYFTGTCNFVLSQASRTFKERISYSNKLLRLRFTAPAWTANNVSPWPLIARHVTLLVQEERD